MSSSLIENSGDAWHEWRGGRIRELRQQIEQVDAALRALEQQIHQLYVQFQCFDDRLFQRTPDVPKWYERTWTKSRIANEIASLRSKQDRRNEQREYLITELRGLEALRYEDTR